VLQGTASGELMIGVDDYRFKGSVAAFDAETGEERWRLWLTQDDETSGAGVGVWSTPSIDEELGLGFVGAGNTYEPPASPLSDSIIAFDLETGEIAWSTQFTLGDVWSMGNTGGVDGDVGAGPNLWEVDGRKLVGGGDKRGEYHALDRETGEIVWETKMTEGSVLGGVIGTSAYADGHLFVASNHGNADNNAPLSTSSVLSLDAATGDVEWETELDGAIFAPVSATPGLVYVGTTAATLHVLDASDGSELWSMEVPDQVGAGASIVDGVVYWGYGFALLGSGSGEGALMAFALGGDGATATTAPQDESLGAATFRTSCSSCHGTRGQGAIGPSLIGVADRLTEEEHRSIVLDGVRQMPAFGDALTEEEIDAVIQYERTQLGD
jgi:polyvinyl alcohol dehydrogenase (cytochrome)